MYFATKWNNYNNLALSLAAGAAVLVGAALMSPASACGGDDEPACEEPKGEVVVVQPSDDDDIEAKYESDIQGVRTTTLCETVFGDRPCGTQSPLIIPNEPGFTEVELIKYVLPHWDEITYLARLYVDPDLTDAEIMNIVRQALLEAEITDLASLGGKSYADLIERLNLVSFIQNFSPA